MNATNNTNPHEQLVRKIAEQMASEDFTYLITDFKESVINRFIPAARIAVKHMAEKFREGYGFSYAPITDGAAVDRYMTETGLIPSPNQPEP